MPEHVNHQLDLRVQALLLLPLTTAKIEKIGKHPDEDLKTIKNL
ncbi:MAG: hypothetical protein ACLR5I_03380 [Odoribacter splanchnicus]